jgi:hypothetical protein
MDAIADAAKVKRLTHRETLLIVLGMLLPIFMGSLDQTSLASALPTIGRDLGNAHELPWLITAYLLSSTAIIPLYGKIADIRWRALRQSDRVRRPSGLPPTAVISLLAANWRSGPKADMAILRGTPQGGAKLVSRSLAISAPADTKQPPQLGNRRLTFPRRRAVNQIANSDRDVREVVAAWIKLSWPDA